MSGAVYAFDECTSAAGQLATLLGIPCMGIDLHRFPDGESLVQVPPPEDGSTAIVYRSLDHPNDKLVELMLAASALRDNGAGRIVLIAPYLAYMRQDMAFRPGEAVSQRVIGELLSRHFDAVVTVDPHLHRISSLGDVMPGTDAISLTAAAALSAAINPADNPVLVGPDSESRQWVEAIAQPLGLDVLVGEKQRGGDRQVAITINGIERVSGRRAILVDDMVSSGTTLEVAARLLLDAGASKVEALATHCLASETDLRRLNNAGISSMRSTDTVEGPTSEIAIAPVLAGFIGERHWLDAERA